MNSDFEFSTMKQLGRMFGVSSHDIGKWLIAVGLRNHWDKRPSYDAHHSGFVHQTPNPTGYGYFWSWHTEKTLAALEKAGWKITSVTGDAGQRIILAAKGENKLTVRIYASGADVKVLIANQTKP